MASRLKSRKKLIGLRLRRGLVWISTHKTPVPTRITGRVDGFTPIVWDYFLKRLSQVKRQTGWGNLFLHDPKQ